MSMTWFEKAEIELEESYERGEISAQELRDGLRDLRDEMRGAAEEAAENAYNDAMGDW